MSEDWSTGVSIILPTFRRPDGLARALASLAGQSTGGRALELVVVDNDPAGTAREAVAEFAAKAPFPTTYVHEPNPGVSNARNAACAQARGRYLAFLDDDQEAGEGWLEGLLKTLVHYGSALVFCPTEAVIPHAGADSAYMKRFFDRAGPDLQDGVITEVFGCGNSMLDRGCMVLPVPLFDPSANEVGGEDDVLFAYIVEKGGSISWTRHVAAREYIRPHRATRRYIMVRSYAHGQGHGYYAYNQTPRNWLGIARWMVTGIVQSLIFAPIVLLTALIRHPSYIRWLARLCNGIGKIFWPPRFHPKLYGAAMAARKGEF